MPSRTTAALRATTFAIAIAIALALVPAAHAAAIGQATPKRITFTVNKRDRAALRAGKRAVRLRARARAARRLATRDAARIARIQELLAEAQGDEQRLREALEARLVARYEEGAAGGGFAFLLAADDVGEALDRADVSRQMSLSDRELARAHTLSLQRLEDLSSALSELRDLHGEQASVFEEQAEVADAQLVSARLAHVEAHDELREDAGVSGTWYVVSGELPANAFMPFFGPMPGAYSGGTLTPARPATQAQIGAILADPRIQVYAGGRQDIATGRIDGRVLDTLRLLADRFGSVTITSLQSGHGTYTSSGNISEHAYGCAVDIGSLSGTIIQPSTQGPGSITEQGVLFLAALTGDLAPHQVISLNSYGGPTLAMGDHGDHIHLGYHC